MQQNAFQQSQTGGKSRNISSDVLGRDARAETGDRFMGVHHTHSLTMKQPIQLTSKVNITKLTQTLTNKDQKESKEEAKKNYRHIRTEMLKPEDIKKTHEANAQIDLFFDEDLVQAKNEKHSEKRPHERKTSLPPSDDFAEV